MRCIKLKKYILINTLNKGGAERQVKYLFDFFDFEKLILLNSKKQYKVKKENKVFIINKNISNDPFYTRIFKDITYFRILKNDEIIEKNQLVLSFLERSNFLNIKLKKYKENYSIISVRNYLSESLNKFWYIYRKFLIKKYYPKADLIITNSIESKKDLELNFGIKKEKIKVIYNAIDIEKVNLLKMEKIEKKYEELLRNNTVFVSVGNLINQKNYIDLIEVFKYVILKEQNIVLFIIGEGKSRKKIEEKIKKCNLEKNVLLLGSKNNPFKYVSKAHAFILNSKYEGFPNVLIESLACNTPIITKDFKSGPRELFEIEKMNYKKVYKSEIGYLISNNITHEEFSNLIIQSMSEFKCIINREKMQKKVEKFSIEKIMKEWGKIFDDIEFNLSGAE